MILGYVQKTTGLNVESTSLKNYMYCNSSGAFFFFSVSVSVLNMK